MRFKVDENLPQELVPDFAEGGHDAETVVQEGMAGVADRDLLEAARLDGRIFLTLDKGIANIDIFPPTAFPGIVLFRPNSMGRGEVLKFVSCRIASSRLRSADPPSQQFRHRGRRRTETNS